MQNKIGACLLCWLSLHFRPLEPITDCFQNKDVLDELGDTPRNIGMFQQLKYSYAVAQCYKLSCVGVCA